MSEARNPPVEMREHEIGVVRLIGVLGWVAFALIAVAIPALYYTFAIRAERLSLQIETAYTAKDVQSIIFARTEMWEFETVRLLEIVSKRTVDGDAEERTIYDASGKTVVGTKHKAPPPVISITVPVFVSGEKAGAVEAKRSVKNVLWGTGFAGFLGFALGLGGFLIFRSYPLRLLNEALSRLASEKRKSETTLSSIGDGVITVDRENRIVYMNPVAEMCTGWGSDEALGRDIKECYVTEKESEKGDSGIDAPYRLISRNGGKRTIEEVWSPIKDGKSAEAGRVLVFRDVTEKRFLERQVRQAQKLESLGALAGGIAHDFNNLLTIVLGHAELALNEISPVSPVRGNLAEITTAAQRGADLSARMLAYAGKAVWAVERVGLRELVEKLTPVLRTSISKYAVLDLRLEEGLPPIKADPSQIRQIVLILVVNASEAIGDRSGVITVSVGATHCDEEYLRTTETHDTLSPGMYVHLEVTDDGAGMDAETRARIFEPFFSTKFTGRGLGLAAVLGIVRAYKGALKVRSEPGKGTTFKVLFPAAGNKDGVRPTPPDPGD